MEPTITTFRPSSIVLQCGADSLGCDRLGTFNLSIAAHGECVRFIKNFGLPLLVLGGGGYRGSSVARCWAYETGVLTGISMPDQLPSNNYYEFFAPDYRLHPPLTGQIQNLNTAQSLERIRVTIREKLRYLNGAPSVQMQEIPPDLMGWLASEEKGFEEADEDRGTGQAGEARRDVIGRKEWFDPEVGGDGTGTGNSGRRRTRVN